MNKHVQDEVFFDTKKYPEMTFTSSKINFKGDVPASVVGKLTVKGFTRPATLEISSFKCMPHPVLKKMLAEPTP